MDFAKKLRVKPGHGLKLSDFDADDTLGFSKDTDSKKLTDKTIDRLDKLQYLLYAQNRHSLLVILQGMDAAGKDGTIRHVMRGVNPQGCTVTAFKVPSHEESQHDFLWRAHRSCPTLGDIGIFNRSHYEDVLVVRVHKLVPRATWEARYDQINKFESILAENNTVILKFFSAHQQRRTEKTLRGPHRRPQTQLESLSIRFSGAPLLARIRARLRRRP